MAHFQIPPITVGSMTYTGSPISGTTSPIAVSVEDLVRTRKPGKTTIDTTERPPEVKIADAKYHDAIEIEKAAKKAEKDARERKSKLYKKFQKQKAEIRAEQEKIKKMTQELERIEGATSADKQRRAKIQNEVEKINKSLRCKMEQISKTVVSYSKVSKEVIFAMQKRRVAAENVQRLAELRNEVRATAGREVAQSGTYAHVLAENPPKPAEEKIQTVVAQSKENVTACEELATESRAAAEAQARIPNPAGEKTKATEAAEAVTTKAEGLAQTAQTAQGEVSQTAETSAAKAKSEVTQEMEAKASAREHAMSDESKQKRQERKATAPERIKEREQANADKMAKNRRRSIATARSKPRTKEKFARRVERVEHQVAAQANAQAAAQANAKYSKQIGKIENMLSFVKKPSFKIAGVITGLAAAGWAAYEFFNGNSGQSATLPVATAQMPTANPSDVDATQTPDAVVTSTEVGSTPATEISSVGTAGDAVVASETTTPPASTSTTTGAVVTGTEVASTSATSSSASATPASEPVAVSETTETTPVITSTATSELESAEDIVEEELPSTEDIESELAELEDEIYTVQKGDCLWMIAKLLLQDGDPTKVVSDPEIFRKVHELMGINNLRFEPDGQHVMIREGDIIKKYQRVG